MSAPPTGPGATLILKRPAILGGVNPRGGPSGSHAGDGRRRSDGYCAPSIVPDALHWLVRLVVLPFTPHR